MYAIAVIKEGDRGYGTDSLSLAYFGFTEELRKLQQFIRSISELDHVCGYFVEEFFGDGEKVFAEIGIWCDTISINFGYIWSNQYYIDQDMDKIRYFFNQNGTRCIVSTMNMITDYWEDLYDDYGGLCYKEDHRLHEKMLCGLQYFVRIFLQQRELANDLINLCQLLQTKYEINILIEEEGVFDFVEYLIHLKHMKPI